METIAELQARIKALEMENACLTVRTNPPFVKRLAQLSFYKTKRPLMQFELDELAECLKAFEIYADKLLDLHTLSIVAYEAGDTEWHHAICADIEKLEGQAL